MKPSTKVSTDIAPPVHSSAKWYLATRGPDDTSSVRDFSVAYGTVWTLQTSESFNDQWARC